MLQACPQLVKLVMFLYLLRCGQSPRMTKTAQNSACVINTSVSHTNTSVSQESSSSEQETEMQSPSLQPSTSQAQLVSPMFMPYIEGPKMDWTVNDGCIKGS